MSHQILCHVQTCVRKWCQDNEKCERAECSQRTKEAIDAQLTNVQKDEQELILISLIQHLIYKLVQVAKK